ncbi:hypothetical protein B0T13DRAFT_458154 [Neurospora crassa]|nr:hypothetical protein B0T13DRAFT_458154 [Neurospora crassa]
MCDSHQRPFPIPTTTLPTLAIAPLSGAFFFFFHVLPRLNRYWMSVLWFNITNLYAVSMTRFLFRPWTCLSPTYLSLYSSRAPPYVCFGAESQSESESGRCMFPTAVGLFQLSCVSDKTERPTIRAEAAQLSLVERNRYSRDRSLPDSPVSRQMVTRLWLTQMAGGM